jgi:mitogen-activated protein kinase 1/3
LLYDIIIPEKALNNIAQMKCLFVIMEYASLDLKSKLETTKIEWSAQEVKLILYNMLCTINFIHSANIMHRDIKPANILIQDNCKMKFCDFGLSRTIYDVGENETSVAIGDLQK